MIVVFRVLDQQVLFSKGKIKFFSAKFIKYMESFSEHTNNMLFALGL